MTTVWRNRWSGGILAITIITAIGVAIIMPLCLWFVPTMLKWLIIAVIAVPLLWTACLTPRSLTVSSRGVVLRRVVGSLKIPAGEIVEMRRMAREELNGAIRIVGSGGFCGYIGRFRNRRLGVFTMNITEWNNLLKVRTNRRTYIFNGRVATTQSGTVNNS